MSQSLDFSTILQHLKAGGLAARTGWNGKKMWLFLVTDWDVQLVSAAVDKATATFAGSFDSFIAMKNAQGNIVPWLASQGDILATDWKVVTPEEAAS